MGNLVIAAKNKTDLELLEALVKRLGLTFFELTESDMRFLARRKLVETVETFPENDDISEKEINAEVETVRAARYARKSV